MAMMAYKASMFMIFFNFSMVIVNALISPLIFPSNTPYISTYDNSLLNSATTFIFTQFASDQGILGMIFISGLMALFAFSLLIPTIPFVTLLFGLSGIIMSGYITQIPIDPLFKAPLIAGVALITYGGISQYAARSTFSGN